ncbi:MAG: redoxin family protein [Alphaproteobacteria bacterium]
MKRSITAAIAACFISANASAAVEVGKPAPNFTATDVYGKTVTLADLKGKPVVLEWHNPGCPFIVKHYVSGNMQKLQAYAKGQDVVWLSINSSAEGKQGNMDAKAAKAMIEKDQYSLASHYLLDAKGDIGRLYDAKTTPHMFVIDAEGNIAYMGAIDDKPSADKADIEGAKSYVRETIDNLKQDKPIELASTSPYGCSVKYAN